MIDKQCLGTGTSRKRTSPDDPRCEVRIPADKPGGLCHFCERTESRSMDSVGDVLAHLCPCGGDPSFPRHEASLLHVRWAGSGVPGPIPVPPTPKEFLRGVDRPTVLR